MLTSGTQRCDNVRLQYLSGFLYDGYARFNILDNFTILCSSCKEIRKLSIFHLQSDETVTHQECADESDESVARVDYKSGDILIPQDRAGILFYYSTQLIKKHNLYSEKCIKCKNLTSKTCVPFTCMLTGFDEWRESRTQTKPRSSGYEWWMNGTFASCLAPLYSVHHGESSW
jgi:hypothetical protein